jgi:protoheme IX farnesyltransferase
VFKQIMALIKFRIALLSTLSAATGFIVEAGGFHWEMALFIFGLFILAGGAAAQNQYQERNLDRLMERTRTRPLPSGKISPALGLTISTMMLLGGHAILYLWFGPIPALLGFATVLLYNGMYTYLKRVTPFAAVPGALIGALPPAIGWFAAGGNWESPILIGLTAFFFIWQVPHFWLLLGIYSKDYNRAGFPSMTDVFSPSQLSRVTYTWIAATACAGALFPLFGMFNHTLTLALLVPVVLWLPIRAVPLARKQLSSALVFRNVFMTINMFALMIMILLIVDHGVLI